MKSKRITIVDYGVGNLYSVMRAFEVCGVEDICITSDPAKVTVADRLVLPGVGAFLNGMNGLRERGLVDPLRSYAASGKPLLGICLGMQLLFSQSSEFGEQRGLDIIEGGVVPIDPKGGEGLPLKVPHIGWSKIMPTKEGPQWGSSLMKHVNGDASCYFVHSFTAVPRNETCRLADAYYGSSRISAAVAKGNVYGCQFHPEKSGPIGLSIIGGFLEI
jgi:glutamine amidotransferase